MWQWTANIGAASYASPVRASDGTNPPAFHLAHFRIQDFQFSAYYIDDRPLTVWLRDTGKMNKATFPFTIEFAGRSQTLSFSSNRRILRLPPAAVGFVLRPGFRVSPEENPAGERSADDQTTLDVEVVTPETPLGHALPNSWIAPPLTGFISRNVAAATPLSDIPTGQKDQSKRKHETENFFFSPPGGDGLFGPVAAATQVGSFHIPGFRANFYVIPKSASAAPIFLVEQGPPRRLLGAFSLQLFKDHNSRSLDFEGFTIDGEDVDVAALTALAAGTVIVRGRRSASVTVEVVYRAKLQAEKVPGVDAADSFATLFEKILKQSRRWHWRDIRCNECVLVLEEERKVVTAAEFPTALTLHGKTLGLHIVNPVVRELLPIQRVVMTDVFTGWPPFKQVVPIFFEPGDTIRKAAGKIGAPTSATVERTVVQSPAGLMKRVVSDCSRGLVARFVSESSLMSDVKEPRIDIFNGVAHFITSWWELIRAFNLRRPFAIQLNEATENGAQRTVGFSVIRTDKAYSDFRNEVLLNDSARRLFLRDGETDRDDEREMADAGDHIPEKAQAALILMSTGMKKIKRPILVRDFQKARPSESE
jgi:hypothetical protein